MRVGLIAEAHGGVVVAGLRHPQAQQFREFRVLADRAVVAVDEWRNLGRGRSYPCFLDTADVSRCLRITSHWPLRDSHRLMS